MAYETGCNTEMTLSTCNTRIAQTGLETWVSIWKPHYGRPPMMPTCPPSLLCVRLWNICW